MAVNIICIFVSIINFIISLYYLNLYQSEKEYSKKLYEESLNNIQYNTDLLRCLYLYKKAYDKSYNKMNKDDFDIKYPKRYLSEHSQLVSELHRFEKWIREWF